METEKTKGTISRSMIPVPKTYSLQRLNQTQSTGNLLAMSNQTLNRSPTTCRRITRHSSASRLPTCGTITAKVRPPMIRSVSGISNSSYDLTSNSTNCKTNSIKSKVSPKLFKQNENYANCQRYQKTHNQSHTQSKTTNSFKIYNKFSPYYENESLESQTSDNANCNQKQNSGDFDSVSNISSTEGSANSSRVTVSRVNKRGIPYHCQQRSNSRLSTRTRAVSVPEHIQKHFKYESNDSIHSKPNETVNKLLIEKLKNRLIQSIDNEEEEQELYDENTNDDQQDYEIPQNIETKLLRIVIRHLREKLNQMKTNSDQITQQLASNKQMSEAFQKSLSTMTIRAQQLTQQLDSKQTELDNICHQLKDKNLDFEDMNRRFQLLDTECKKLQKLNTNLINNNNNNNENNSRTDSSMSTVSYGDSLADGSAPVKFRKTSSWLKGSTISKAFKRRKKLNIFSNSSSDLLSTTKESTESSVSHLKDLIREKELTITDLKLESLVTTNRLERLEGDLKNSREESFNLKKNKDFLENMIKMKIIE